MVWENDRFSFWNDLNILFLARRLVAVCEHSFCGENGVCIVIDTTFGCVCPDGGIASRCIADGGLSKSIDRKMVDDGNILVSYCAAGCLNNGVCDQIAGTCTCPSGFAGVRCEIARSEMNFFSKIIKGRNFDFI